MTTKIGFGYARMSLDREGLARGVDRQSDDIKALAEQEGITLAHIFIDNDISASTLSKKKRPEYASMLERIHNGEAGFILSYSNSRLTRRPLELEDLIRLHDQTGVRIFTKVSGRDDLSTADGRMVARIKASVDAAEAEKISERAKRAHKQRAEQGRQVGGPRAFGWNANRLTLNPFEAALVREGVDTILAGRTLADVARDWNQKGAKTTRGNPWDQGAVRQYLNNYRLVGIRGLYNEPMIDAEGLPIRGEWEAILTNDQWVRLVAVLSGNREANSLSKRARHGAYRYLLSGILRCTICGNTMVGNPVPDNPGGRTHNYTCRGRGSGRNHTVTVDGCKTDELITDALIAFYSKAELPTTEASFEGDERLAELQDERSNTLQQMTGKTLSHKSGLAVLRMIDEEEEALNDERAAWLLQTTGPSVERLTLEEWRTKTLGEQRAVVMQQIEAVMASPRIRLSKNFDPNRIEIVWK